MIKHEKWIERERNFIKSFFILYHVKDIDHIDNTLLNKMADDQFDLIVSDVFQLLQCIAIYSMGEEEQKSWYDGRYVKSFITRLLREVHGFTNDQIFNVLDQENNYAYEALEAIIESSLQSSDKKLRKQVRNLISKEALGRLKELKKETYPSPRLDGVYLYIIIKDIPLDPSTWLEIISNEGTSMLSNSSTTNVSTWRFDMDDFCKAIEYIKKLL